jgi:hypothetical protein
MILDEMILDGVVVETNRKNILDPVALIDTYAKKGSSANKLS